MGARVGIPMLKLSAGGQQTKRKGSAYAVAREAFSERCSADPDLDRSRSDLNTYQGYTSGSELYAYWQQEAGKHRDALGRGLRKDAVIGYSAICKPDKEFMDGLTATQQDAFLADSQEVLTAILAEHGLQVDAVATHRDEENPHLHIFGHDPEYKAGKKINLGLFRAFNRTYPERMRQRGWEVDELKAYDEEAVAKMSEEEASEYKARHISQKKARGHGKSSLAYKLDKVAAERKALEEEKARLQGEQQRLALERTQTKIIREHLEEDLQAQDDARQELADEKAELVSAKHEFASAKAGFAAEESSLKAEKRAFDRERQEFMQEKKKWQETANFERRELEKGKRELAAEKESVQEVKKGYEHARTTYINAADKASGVASGLSLDTAEKYGQAFQAELMRQLQCECEKTRYTDGRTAWDFLRQPATRAVQASVQAATRKIRPQTGQAVLGDLRERTARADRGLPTYTGPGSQPSGSSGYEPGY